MDAGLRFALLLVLLAVVAVHVAVVEATSSGLDLLQLRLLPMRAQEEGHGDVGGCEDCFERPGDYHRRLSWAGCDVLACLLFMF